MNKLVTFALMALLLMAVLSVGCSNDGTMSPLTPSTDLDSAISDGSTTGSEFEMVGDPDKTLMTCMIRGFVYYMDSTPASGVEVVVRIAVGSSWLDPVYRTTDANGFFAYSRTLNTSNQNYIQCGSLNCQVTQPWVHPHGAPVEFVLTEQEEVPPGKGDEILQDP